MGSSVSAGRTNDELVDHLVDAEFIKTPLIQRVFRAVDRGNYYIQQHKQNAYKDIAWKMGKLHLSAPCVYSVVMEALKLRSGLSFLNLGSGSGYLSTMVGLVLGTYGVNHGVELYDDIVEFAYERLDEFMKNSKAIDEFDFCEPTFSVGNCLKLDSATQQYDRVYCGASCPTEYEPYLKNLVKVGGILIMPLEEKLLKITRTSETRWHTNKILSVSFAPLVVSLSSKESIPEAVKLGDISPPKLQHLCRASIRDVLKERIDTEHPDLKQRQERKYRQCRRQVRRIVIPFYESDRSDSSSDGDSDYFDDSDSRDYTISSRLPSRMSVFLEDFLRRHTELQLLKDMEGAWEETSESEPEDPSDRLDLPPLPDAAEVDAPPREDRAQAGDELFSLITVSNITQSASSDESMSKPPSQSTRSCKRKRLQRKRRRERSRARAGSSSSQPQRKKVRRTSATVVWKKRVEEEKSDSKEKEDEDAENYTEYIVPKIGALPLPSLLLRYLNYKRENL